jgi:Cdc6-like AAA superfamily ATPase
LSLEQRIQQQKLKEWLTPADPWTNHASARRHHEPGTGVWLLESSTYQRWKSGAIRHIWLYGKAGCGKTIISSTLIEDMRAHCEGRDDVCLGIFYFTFSDQKKQTYEDLLRSLATQLAMNGPGLSVLQRTCDKANNRGPTVIELEDVVIVSAQSYSNVMVMLDALDECPEERNARYEMLEGLEKLTRDIPRDNDHNGSDSAIDRGICSEIGHSTLHFEAASI